MKRKRRSIHDVIEYTPDQIKFHERRNERMKELGLIDDLYNRQVKKGNNNSNNDAEVKLALELSHLEVKAMELIDNYQEIPDEIKNRIFERHRLAIPLALADG